MSVSHKLRALAGLTLAALAACSEHTGPARLADPAATAAKVNAVDSVFSVPAIDAFTSIGDLIDPASGLAPAANLVRATQPDAPRPWAPGYAGAAQRYRAFGTLSLAPSNTLGLIPDELKGKTFEWDIATDHYVVTDRPGAPADGVRFILYAINPITRRPAEPLVEVGYVDLIDLSTENSRSLRIVVNGVGGTPNYVDYTVTGTLTPGQFTASANGFISNGESGDASKKLIFELEATLTLTSFTFTASLTLDHPAVTITETTTATKSLTGVTLTIDFTLVEPAQKVQLLGSVTVTDDDRESDGHREEGPGRHGDDGILTADLQVLVNDQLFATIKGTAPDIQILGADGQPLSAEELHALRELFRFPARVFSFFQDLLHPVRRCFRV
ncbi:MAG: hypothetical protein ACREMW_02860 [Gemmatimonadales bacterium]